ncbi:MAG: flippase-like domain-containing protein [Candidatus Eisenbacteria bacterium]|uniref:Flippase-like domain-containing protein n=1 Tax=Eiseniibacteriota bacterium TaxID=2212470 RepID=A0A948RTB7_UNCEI|nr:flippase-like domain-containing protein [Candidatus Eisenbacteria bacterium]MBU1949834.1 flippase-like domain-containing protein [Candidatus Eisenbacteria bacterium]MBU2690633.1 flippase-like domain-containing protein [Candidatus Eisenbacteria bacterium]
MKRKLLFGSILSLLFLYLAFRKSDFAQIIEHIRNTRMIYLLPGVILTLLSYFVRAVRWRYLLASVKTISLSPLFKSTMIGFMANNLLPARLGELVRAHTIGTWEGISRSSALATIAMERVFDLYTMLVLFGVISIFLPLTPAVQKLGMIGLLFGLLVLGLFILLLRAGPKTIQLFGRYIPSRFRERGIGLLCAFQEGLGVLKKGRQLLWASMLSVLMWGFIVGVIYLCFTATEIEVDGKPLPVSAAVVVLVVMAIGLMVPSGPGFIGSLQLAAKLGLRVFGVEDNMALSFAIVYHATQWVPVTLVGLIFLIHANLSLKEISRTSTGDKGRDPTGAGL